jgi:hypothetical protein
MELTCKACEAAARKPPGHSGLYDMACHECCVRLVLQTWPSRERAAAMLEVIRRCGGDRAAVLAEVRKRLPSG